VGPPYWTCAFHGKGILGVNQRIGNVPIGPAETDDSDAISVNQPSAIQKINGTVVHRHGCRNFLGRAYEMNIHVGVPDLQTKSLLPASAWAAKPVGQGPSILGLDFIVGDVFPQATSSTLAKGRPWNWGFKSMNNDFWPAPGATAKIRGGWFLFSSRTISGRAGAAFACA
jgi:hypothetical protein